MGRDEFFLLLRETAANFSDVEMEARLENFRRDHPDYDNKELVRRWIEFRLRQAGVVYGTPLVTEDEVTQGVRSDWARRRAVFLAILRIEAELAMEVGCTVSHCSRGLIRVAELLVCFALLARRFGLARRIHRRIRELPEDGPAPEFLLSLARRIGKRVERRAYLAGNPLIGLPVHNGFNYIDAKTLGRLAVAYFERGGVDRSAVRRVLDHQDEERRMLMEGLIGLNLAERPASAEVRRIVRAQIRASGLSWCSRWDLRRMLRHPDPASVVARAVKNERFGDFLLEQVILGSLLDGHLSERESLYIGRLAELLQVPPARLAEREAQVLDFYQSHKAYLDAFMVSTAVKTYRQQLLSRLQRAIGENLDVIAAEVRSTGELAELVKRWSLGERLNDAERARLRRGLLDVLRTVPSLAIFTLPGGAVLLPLLLKVLPAALKPASLVQRDRQRAEAARRGEGD
jgi:hypothetical protein